MALLKIWEASRAIMRLLVIQFVWWLGWFSTFALAQFEISEGVTGSVTFPALGVTCVANLAVFVTTLIRGRLHLEMGAGDVLEILSAPKLQNIKRIKHGYGLTTCIQKDAAIGGGGGDTQTGSTEENDVQNGGGDPTEGGHSQTASTEEIDVQTASTSGPQAASTEGGGGDPTEGSLLPTASTAEDQVGSEAAAAGAAAAEAAAAAAAGASTETLGVITMVTPHVITIETPDVIMLSNGTANWSMRQFIKSNAHLVQSIVLEFLPLKRAIEDKKVIKELTSGVTILESCECGRCDCIVFWTMEETTHMLARRMPRTLKRLSDSLCLLPCSTCLREGCHECKPENLLRVEGEASQPLRERVVSGILYDIHAGSIAVGRPICICVPMNDARGDNWTKLLVRSLRSKETESRGVRNLATEALEGYLGGGRGSEKRTVEYDILSFVVPRLTEVLINLVLTFWFRVDGFSSALVARRTVRDYLMDSKSSGFAANAFLAEAVVKSNGDNSQVCQVLTFRGRDRLCMITFISVGCVNLICSLGWALLISFEGGPDSSRPPSMPIVAAIIAAMGTPWSVMTLLMACLPSVSYIPMMLVEGYCGGQFAKWSILVSVTLLFVLISPVLLPGLLTVAFLKWREEFVSTLGFVTALGILEMTCFVSWSALAGTVGIKGFGRWVYGALQILIWLNWATGSYCLREQKVEEFRGKDTGINAMFVLIEPRNLIRVLYSSSFWLNAVLAGVRVKWEAWPWRHNHLF